MVPVTSVPVPAAQPVDGNVVIVHGTVGGEQHVLPPYGGDGGHDGVKPEGAFSHVTSGVDAVTLLRV